MIKEVKKMFNVFVTTLLMVATLSTQVFAATPSNAVSGVEELNATVYEYVKESEISTYATTFDTATITISYHSSTGMEVLILTYVNGVASVVGVKDILIQMKSGNDWITVATSDGGELSNVQGMGCEITYAGAIEGQTYRVVCTHYADYEGYRELYHESGGMLCRY